MQEQELEQQDKEQIEAVREIENISEYRVREHMDLFYPQIKQIYKYKDTGELHIASSELFINVFPIPYNSLDEATVILDKYLTKPIFYNNEENLNTRIYEHIDKFYPQKKELLKFEEDTVVHPIYKEPVWLNIFDDEGFYTYEEAKEKLDKYLLPEVLHEYQIKE